jgi:hypothetical protein
VTKDATQLRITDSFVRTKRTLLLFSAGLFALGIAAGQKSSSVDLTFLSVDIEAEVVRYLLVAAVAYYSLLFTIEWRSIVRINNQSNIDDSSIDEFVNHLRLRFRDVEAHIQGLSGSNPQTSSFDTLNGLGNQIFDWLKGAPSHTELAEQIELELSHKMPPDGRIDKALIIRAIESANVNAGIKRGGDLYAKEAAGEIFRHASRIDALTAALGAANSNLDKVHHDLTRLSDSLGRERQFAFWGLEVWASYGFAFMAVAVGFPPTRHLLDAIRAALG